MYQQAKTVLHVVQNETKQKQKQKVKTKPKHFLNSSAIAFFLFLFCRFVRKKERKVLLIRQTRASSCGR